VLWAATPVKSTPPIAFNLSSAWLEAVSSSFGCERFYIRSEITDWWRSIVLIRSILAVDILVQGCRGYTRNHSSYLSTACHSSTADLPLHRLVQAGHVPSKLKEATSRCMRVLTSVVLLRDRILSDSALGLVGSKSVSSSYYRHLLGAATNSALPTWETRHQSSRLPRPVSPSHRIVSVTARDRV
jgi:hypothetical protein